MKVLFITSKPAYPKVDGGCVASANFLDNLMRSGAEVKYLTISTNKHPFISSKFPEELVNKTAPEGVYIDTSVRSFSALKSLFNKHSYNVDRFYNPNFEAKIVDTIHEQIPDVIILDSLFSTPYLKSIRKYHSGKVILRAHNIEHIIWKGLSLNTSNPFKKLFLKKLASDLRNYELDLFKSIDGIITLSTDDLDTLKQLDITTPSRYIPITLETQPVEHPYENNTLFHLGAMNWQPNTEAVNKVIELLPEIRKVKPKLSFYIAGMDSEKYFTENTREGIHVEGFVKNLEGFLSGMGILISPVQSGSGIRIKILEMMSRGIPVITTSLGAQGLINTDGVLLADSDKELTEAIYELYTDENKRRELGTKAKHYINLHHNPEKVSEEIIEFIRSI